MSTYDPRRSRPTPKVAPDEESAPIDVLLGPGPEEEDAAATPATAAAPPSPGPAPVRRVERAPSAVVQLAPLLAVVLAILVAWLVRRARR